MLIDSHTHLDQFPADQLPDILDRASQAAVSQIVIAGTTISSSTNAVALTSFSPMLYAGVGIHPMDITKPFDEKDYEALKDLSQHPRVLVISETGMDFLATSPDSALQEQVFRQHLRLARETKLPVVFHSRDAHVETLQILKEEQIQEIGGIFHYFQGDKNLAYTAIDLGIYISLGRPLLRLACLQQVIEHIPLEYLVLESDSYPQPFKKYRHNWTEPRHIAEIASKVAELKGITFEEVASVTTKNFRKLTNKHSYLD